MLRDLPRPRRGAGQGRRPRGDDGRADGPRDGHLQGQGRLDAPLRAVGRPRSRRTRSSRATSRWPAAPRCRASSGRPARSSLCFFGDGASCEGEFFETMNMAMLWKVPLVFVCENNGVAISRADVEEPGDAGHRRPCPRLRHAGRDRRRQRRARGRATRSPRASSARAAGGGPDLRRVQDRALGAALRLLGRRQRPGEQRRAWQRGRPDPALPEVARRLGRRERRATSTRSTRRSAPRCEAVRAGGRGAPVPGARVDLRGHLCAVARSRAARPACLARGPAGPRARR